MIKGLYSFHFLDIKIKGQIIIFMDEANGIYFRQ